MRIVNPLWPTSRQKDLTVTVEDHTCPTCGHQWSTAHTHMVSTPPTFTPEQLCLSCEVKQRRKS